MTGWPLSSSGLMAWSGQRRTHIWQSVHFSGSMHGTVGTGHDDPRADGRPPPEWGADVVRGRASPRAPPAFSDRESHALLRRRRSSP